MVASTGARVEDSVEVFFNEPARNNPVPGKGGIQEWVSLRRAEVDGKTLLGQQWLGRPGWLG
jgi:hypothetical protein